MSIKLKLGKEETATQSENESTTSNSEQQETAVEQKPSDESPPTQEKQENADEIRHVIKLDENKEGSEEKEEPAKEEEEKPEKATITVDPSSSENADEPTGDLEQRRHILQSIKDFDFQIKKNQESIGKVSDRINSLTKDLDDLVSLYEIVSEQMNPFVGLSKVTKKRLDALENYTKEVEELKTKIGDIESILEKKGAEIGDLIKNQQTMKTNLQHPSPESVAETMQQQQQEESAIEEDTPQIIVPPEPILSNETESMNYDFDQLFESSFNSIMIEQNIDAIINDFIQSLMT